MRTQTRLLLRWACTLALCSGLGVAQADIYIITNAAAPTGQLSREQIADLYLGRMRTIDSGIYVTLLDQPDEQPVRQRFFRLIANMTLSQVNAYWAKLTFTGRQNPPLQQANDARVIETVSRNPRTIGYVSSPPSDNQVRVLLHLHE